MPAKKYTAAQLRKAQEIVDQEEAVVAERISRRRRRREEWYQRHAGEVVLAAVLLFIALLFVWNPFRDFNSTELQRRALPLIMLILMTYFTWDWIRTIKSEGFNPRSFVAWIKIIALLVFSAVLLLGLFVMFWQANFQ